MKILYLPKSAFQKIAAVLLIVGISCVYSIGGGFKYLNVFLNDRTEIPIFSVDTGENQIALTFDVSEGVDFTEQILSILDKKNVKATFFLVGGWIEKNPEVAKKIIRNGHEAGNHSNTHQHMADLDKTKILEEIKSCNEKIKKITGSTARFFRIPFNEYDSTVVEAAASQKLLCVQGDVSTLDISLKDDAKIINDIVKKTDSGSIIMMPAGSSKTPEVLEQVIAQLRDKGYNIVMLSELIMTQDYYVDHTGRQRNAN